MPNQQFIVISRAKPGAEQEFDRWYDEEHLADVVAVPGVVKAKRFRVVNQEPANFETPSWYSVAVYEIEADDPRSVIAEITARTDNGKMLISDSIDTEIILLLLAEQTAEVS